MTVKKRNSTQLNHTGVDAVSVFFTSISLRFFPDRSCQHRLPPSRWKSPKRAQPVYLSGRKPPSYSLTYLLSYPPPPFPRRVLRWKPNQGRMAPTIFFDKSRPFSPSDFVCSAVWRRRRTNDRRHDDLSSDRTENERTNPQPEIGYRVE